MSIVLKKIDVFRENSFYKLKNHYSSLKTGQQPHTLFITCSDSRLCPQEITQSQAGELFIIRNAGNMLSPYNSDYPSNEGLTLEYGVITLKVKEVVICGHRFCGAMGGLQNIRSLNAMPLVQKVLGRYKENHREEISQCKDLDSLTAWNVNKQLLNLLSYPFITNKIASRELNLYGIVYDFTRAQITHRSYVNSRNGKIINEA